jgi:hypothetical protein
MPPRDELLAETGLILRGDRKEQNPGGKAGSLTTILKKLHAPSLSSDVTYSYSYAEGGKVCRNSRQ